MKTAGQDNAMHDASRAKASRKRGVVKDLAARKSADVKGGFVIDWAAANPTRPGEERGVIAIIKPAGGA
jgi:hypothetical protein